MKNQLFGRAIPYNSLSTNPMVGFPGDLRERILPGAFRESIETSPDIFILWSHQIQFVLGRTSRGTLKLREDNDGVHFENDVPGCQWAKDLLVSVLRGDIRNMSFGFGGDKVEWTRERDVLVRNIHEATLLEISVVTVPVYETSSVSVRGDGEPLPTMTEEERKNWDRYSSVMKRYDRFRERWFGYRYNPSLTEEQNQRMGKVSKFMQEMEDQGFGPYHERKSSISVRFPFNDPAWNSFPGALQELRKTFADEIRASGLSVPEGLDPEGEVDQAKLAELQQWFNQMKEMKTQEVKD